MGGTSKEAISLRPSYKNKPTTTKMKQIIAAVLQEKLENVPYQSERASQLTKEIADAVKLQLKSCEYPRCKYLVQVVIGEQRGEGVRMGCRCFWDAETDCYATETYTSVQLSDCDRGTIYHALGQPLLRSHGI